MSDSSKYKNKYREASARLQNWDYGSNAAYFITICTKNRQHFFGDIVDGIMQFNELGQLAEQYWLEIPNHFPYAVLGNHVVMPNHVHGMLIIDKKDVDVQCNHCRDAINRVPTMITFNTTKRGGFAGNMNPMLNENISRIVRWYKGRCTFENRKLHADFEWQSRFHDHIVRNADEFERISLYIQHNATQWDDDSLNI